MAGGSVGQASVTVARSGSFGAFAVSSAVECAAPSPKSSFSSRFRGPTCGLIIRVSGVRVPPPLLGCFQNTHNLRERHVFPGHRGGPGFLLRSRAAPCGRLHPQFVPKFYLGFGCLWPPHTPTPPPDRRARKIGAALLILAFVNTCFFSRKLCAAHTSYIWRPSHSRHQISLNLTEFYLRFLLAHR